MSFANTSDLVIQFANAHETIKPFRFFNKVEDSILKISFLVCVRALLRDSKLMLGLND